MKVSFEKRKKFYKSRAWIKKRKEIIERDNNECQDCKRKGYAIVGQLTKLDIHHIRFLETNWNLRLKNDNLITLCVECHNKKHPEKFEKIKSGIHSQRFE